jgi:hypothetical protein
VGWRQQAAARCWPDRNMNPKDSQKTFHYESLIMPTNTCSPPNVSNTS